MNLISVISTTEHRIANFLHHYSNLTELINIRSNLQPKLPQKPDLHT
uniref:Uncharacterized protein n=1 Tax=Arundo donax TaxID=35708 RepID=A0A0A9C972_ARUDO